MKPKTLNEAISVAEHAYEDMENFDLSVAEALKILVRESRRLQALEEKLREILKVS